MVCAPRRQAGPADAERVGAGGNLVLTPTGRPRPAGARRLSIRSAPRHGLLSDIQMSVLPDFVDAAPGCGMTMNPLPAHAQWKPSARSATACAGAPPSRLGAGGLRLPVRPAAGWVERAGVGARAHSGHPVCGACACPSFDTTYIADGDGNTRRDRCA